MSTIFIGNISYDVTKEDIIRMFSVCGNVLGFRFVTDKDTGKSRGFGFCEFENEDQAEDAISRFNNTILNGRTIKVDSADGDNQGKGVGPSGGRMQKDIDKALDDIGLIQLYDIIFKFKEFIRDDYQAARKLLVQYPVLSQSMIKICTIFGQINNQTDQNMAVDVSPSLAEDVIQELLSLTPQQIESLPEEEKQKVLDLIQRHVQIQNQTYG